MWKVHPTVLWLIVLKQEPNLNLDIIGEVLEPPAYNDEFDKGRVAFPLWWRFIQYEELVINAVIFYQSLIHRQPNKHVSSFCMMCMFEIWKSYIETLSSWTHGLVHKPNIEVYNVYSRPINNHKNTSSVCDLNKQHRNVLKLWVLPRICTLFESIQDSINANSRILYWRVFSFVKKYYNLHSRQNTP